MAPNRGIVYRWEILRAITRSRVIGIIRNNSRSAALEAAAALFDAGLTVVEISLTTPHGLDAVSDLATAARPGQLIGAGTVLDAETARLAVAAGARFVVSPNVSSGVVSTAHRYGIPALPGASTPTEIVRALEVGGDMIKLFPAAQLGVGHLRAVRAALPQAPLVPTGGVDSSNAADWLAAGAVALGVGGALTSGTTAEMQEAARELLAALPD
jgi:2-dehydro-3-deoxyphosphogluconate aldolase / (4S)-4-hydroxy-2-oxoglutarate aldolase